jgi:UDP-2,4-diacetamido-2,4,6-trideoxy-beta-L-altropyranose hydrolase
MSSCVVIRADGNSRIGTGHIMRCIALGQGLRRSGSEVVFTSAEVSSALEQRLHESDFALEKLNVSTIGSSDDAERTIQLARELHSEWIVADGYSFSANYQRRIKQAGSRLLLLDDYGHADHYFADLILNQNLHANAALYANREKGSVLLLGTRYALLRREFLISKFGNREITPTARKILVTLGGSDLENISSKVIKALKQFPQIEARIIVGGTNPHVDSLRSLVSDCPSLQMVVDTRNMQELMAWADLAIAAAGTTMWEMAFMGLPALMLVLADNQRSVAEALTAAEVARQSTITSLVTDLHALLPDFAMRKTMSERAMQLVDGLGVSRVVSHFRASQLRLRPVRTDDCRQIWEWANDPEARAASVAEKEIPWASHIQWFSSRVNSPTCLFYVAQNSDEDPIGQIRFEISGAEAVLSVSLVKAARGHGHGSALIVRGSQRCFAESRVNLIRAFVKPANETSIRAFERTDFIPWDSVELHGQRMRQFILKREANS